MSLSFGRTRSAVIVALVAFALGGCPANTPTPPAAPLTACDAGSGVRPAGNCFAVCPGRQACNNCCGNLGEGDPNASSCIQTCETRNPNPNSMGITGAATVVSLLSNSTAEYIRASGDMVELMDYLAQLPTGTYEILVNRLAKMDVNDASELEKELRVGLPLFDEQLKEWSKAGWDISVAGARYQIYDRMLAQYLGLPVEVQAADVFSESSITNVISLGGEVNMSIGIR